MKELTQRLALHTRRRDVGADSINRKHEERKYDALSELGNIEYILQAGEQGLYHLCLAARGPYFIKSTFTELMGAHGKLGFEFTHAENLDPRLQIFDKPLLHEYFRRYGIGAAHFIEIGQIDNGIFLQEKIGEAPF